MAPPRFLSTLEPKKTAHLIVDMQHGFTHHSSPLYTPMAAAQIPRLNEFTAICRQFHIQNIFIQMTVDLAEPDSWDLRLQQYFTNEEAQWRRDLFAPNTFGWALDSRLKHNDTQDLAMPKRYYSALLPGSSNLHDLLQQRGITTLLISGTATDVCCACTARDAMQLNYRVVMLADLTSTDNLSLHESTLASLTPRFADIQDSQDVAKHLQKSFC